MKKIITYSLLILLLLVSTKCQSDDSDILNEEEVQFNTDEKKPESEVKINQTSTST